MVIFSEQVAVINGNSPDESQASESDSSVEINRNPMLHHERSFDFQHTACTVTISQCYMDLDGTGGGVWDASIALAYFLDSMGPMKISNKVIIELGSGLGLVSIVASLFGARVYATDGDAAILPYLQRNIENVFSSLSRADAAIAVTRPVVSPLLWFET